MVSRRTTRKEGRKIGPGELAYLQRRKKKAKSGGKAEKNAIPWKR